MEPVKQTYVDPADVKGQELNEIQDSMVESRFADSCTDNAPNGYHPPTTITTQRVGAVILLQHHEIAAGPATVTTLDESRDWRDRYVRGWVAGENASNQKLPGGNAFVSSDSAPTYDGVRFWGYSGLGSVAGAPPAPAAGAGQGEQWDLRTWEAASFGGVTWGVLGTSIIYVDSATGYLCFYNNGGGIVYLWGKIFCSGDIGGV